MLKVCAGKRTVLEYRACCALYLTTAYIESIRPCYAARFFLSSSVACYVPKHWWRNGWGAWPQWRNVAPVAPASPGGAMRRGRQNFELKLFGCKNVPYVGQINVRWWGKNIWGYKKLQGAPKSFRGAKKLQGAQEAYKKNRKNSGDLFFFFFFFFRRQ